jgi:5,10-methylenetetrahydrofolate reductase
MKITEKLQKAEREGRTFWSFEFFPPRTAQVCPAKSWVREGRAVRAQGWECAMENRATRERHRSGKLVEAVLMSEGSAEPLRSDRAHARPWPRVHRHHLVSFLDPAPELWSAAHI